MPKISLGLRANVGKLTHKIPQTLKFSRSANIDDGETGSSHSRAAAAETLPAETFTLPENQSIHSSEVLGSLPEEHSETPIWVSVVRAWEREHSKESEKLGHVGENPDLQRLIAFQPDSKTSKETVSRLKRWVPILADVRGIVMPIAALDPNKVAPIICASVFFSIQIAFDYIDPTERDKILDFLVESGQIINECILFENGFLRRGHPVVKKYLPELEKGLVEQYRAALDLITTIKYCYKSGNEQKEDQGKFDSVKAWFEARANIAKTVLTSKVTEWEAEQKALKRLKLSWSDKKKSLDTELESDQETRTVLAWLKDKEDSEALLDTLKKRETPEGRYHHSSEWFLGGHEFFSWLPKLSSLANKGESLSNRFLWVRGALGSGKTHLIFQAASALRDRPELHIQTGPLRLAWYFCNSGNPALGKHGCQTIIRGLAARLALMPNFSLSKEASKSYNEAISTASLEKDHTIDFWQDLFEAVLKDQTSRSAVVIVVDALDECEPAQADKFLKFMIRILKKHTNLHFLCSSQLHVRVRHWLSRSHGTDQPTRNLATNDIEQRGGQCTEVTMTPRVTFRSMAEFISGEITAREDRLSIFYNPDFANLKSELETLLTANAHGMFKWVELWLEIFLPRDAEESRTIRLKKDARTRLDELRAEIGSKEQTTAFSEDKGPLVEERRADTRLRPAYLRLWHLDELPGFKDMRILLFHLILGTFSPLPIAQLRDALRISSDEWVISKEDVLRLCSNFLYAEKGNFLRFEHNSARNFVLSLTKSEVQRDSTCDDKVFTQKQHHHAIKDLFFDLMRSSTNKYWTEMLGPEWTSTAWRYKRRIDIRVKYTGGGRQIHHYLLENGLHHCKLAAEKDSMFDEVWTAVIDDLIIAQDSAFGYLVMTQLWLMGSPAESALVVNGGVSDLLYPHVLVMLDIISEDDLSQIQITESTRIRSDRTQEEHRQFRLFEHVSCIGGTVAARLSRPPWTQATALNLACLESNIGAVRVILEVVRCLEQDKVRDILFQPEPLHRHQRAHCIDRPLCLAIFLGDVFIAKTLLLFEKEHDSQGSTNVHHKAVEHGISQSEVPWWQRDVADYTQVPLSTCLSKQWSLRYSRTGETALTNAIVHLAEEDTLQLLRIAGPAEVDYSDRSNFTSLHLAAGLGRLRLVKVLTENFHADINAQDNQSQTPALYAYRYGQTEVLNYLTARGAQYIQPSREQMAGLETSSKRLGLRCSPRHGSQYVYIQDPLDWLDWLGEDRDE